MIKLCFIDLETTGVDHKKNAIIQIAGMIYFLDKANFDSKYLNRMIKLETFNFNLKPFDTDIIEDKALEVTKLTREEIFQYEDPKDVFFKLTNILNKRCDKYNRRDKFFFVAYNARFDCDFLRTFFEKNGDNYFGSYFFFPPVDVVNAAIFNCIQDRHLLENFKLETVAKHFNVFDDNGEFHDAMKDIRVTKNLFIKFLERN